MRNTCMFLRVQCASYLPIGGFLPRMLVRAAVFITVSVASCSLWGQGNSAAPSVLHIQRSVTSSQNSLNGVPQFLFMYHAQNGATSPAQALSLKGGISLKNDSANFSEVLWLVAYWKGKCPVNDQSLAGANFIWSDILKNPSPSDSNFRVDLQFPHPLPMSGCVGFVFGGGPLLE